ncbi:MAG: hypothetical protein IJ728_09115 [Selenomonadaceae bacterium]|nr:hypothetical protein [Selenomonadaceae bacterium]
MNFFSNNYDRILGNHHQRLTQLEENISKLMSILPVYSQSSIYDYQKLKQLAAHFDEIMYLIKFNNDLERRIKSLEFQNQSSYNSSPTIQSEEEIVNKTANYVYNLVQKSLSDLNDRVSNLERENENLKRENESLKNEVEYFKNLPQQQNLTPINQSFAINSPPKYSVGQPVVINSPSRSSVNQSVVINSSPKPELQKISPSIYPLDLSGKRGRQIWLSHKAKIFEIKNFKKFVSDEILKRYPNYEWFSDRLEKVDEMIKNFPEPVTFDENTTNEIADFTIKIAKQFMGVLQSCESTIKNSPLSSQGAKIIKNAVESYLKNFGVSILNFNVGDRYEDWANLGMNDPVSVVKTSDRNLYNTIKEINIQPHYFSFIDSNGKEKKIYFGGSCTVYGL